MRRSFGDFLRSLRKEKKKTQRDLAREVGIDHTYLSKVENQAPGFTSPSEPTLRKLASALETDADEMITAAGKVPSDVRQMLEPRDDALRRADRPGQVGVEHRLRLVLGDPDVREVAAPADRRDAYRVEVDLVPIPLVGLDVLRQALAVHGASSQTGMS